MHVMHIYIHTYNMYIICIIYIPYIYIYIEREREIGLRRSDRLRSDPPGRSGQRRVHDAGALADLAWKLRGRAAHTLCACNVQLFPAEALTLLVCLFKMWSLTCLSYSRDVFRTRTECVALCRCAFVTRSRYVLAVVAQLLLPRPCRGIGNYMSFSVPALTMLFVVWVVIRGSIASRSAP